MGESKGKDPEGMDDKGKKESEDVDETEEASVGRYTSKSERGNDGRRRIGEMSDSMETSETRGRNGCG